MQARIDALVNDIVVALTEDFETTLEVKREILKEVQKQVNELRVEEVHMVVD